MNFDGTVVLSPNFTTTSTSNNGCESEFIGHAASNTDTVAGVGIAYVSRFGLGPGLGRGLLARVLRRLLHGLLCLFCDVRHWAIIPFLAQPTNVEGTPQLLQPVELLCLVRVRRWRYLLCRQGFAFRLGLRTRRSWPAWPWGLGPSRWRGHVLPHRFGWCVVRE